MAGEAVAAEVHAYLDDQLEPDRGGRIQEHLRGFGACTPLYERQRAVNSGIRQHALDYLAQRAVVALVYRHREPAINLFVWPGDAAGAPQTATRHGYNLVRWSQGGMSFSAVSDLNPADLQAFQELIARSSPPAS